MRNQFDREGMVISAILTGAVLLFVLYYLGFLG